MSMTLEERNAIVEPTGQLINEVVALARQQLLEK